MFNIQVVLLTVVIVASYVGLPCLSSQAKQEFKNTRNKLTALKNDIDKRVRALDADLVAMETDLQKNQWRKYKGHCYYFGQNLISWFEAERKCRHIRGYLIKIDDSSKNAWVKSQLNGKSSNQYWLGLTDLKEGEFRWTYDQEITSYKNWNNGEPNNHRGNEDCILMYFTSGQWGDCPCTYKTKYICENNFCMFILQAVLFTLVLVESSTALPCLSSTGKQEIRSTRNKLTSLKNDIDKKIRALDADLQAMETDLQKKQWRKYKGHCYYFGQNLINWFEAERKCRKNGGYLIKIDDSSENAWIKTQLDGKSSSHYWIGLTDLQEGEYRWTYDQQLVSYKNYHSGQPNNSGGNQDCMQTDHTSGKWQDSVCKTKYKYICENNFCF